MGSTWLPLLVGLLIIASCAAQEKVDKETPDYCYLPAETGDCRAYFPQWYYDNNTGTCEEFIWGGCGGNENRFNNKEECLKTCQPEVCLLPPDTGPCRANIRMWFHNAEERTCQEFSYGGCKGNQNRFSSQHSCELACAGTNLRCALGSEFTQVGKKAVTVKYRATEWFVYGCERRCREACLADHTWGVCHAYSVRRRWVGCNCYLFDRHLSDEEFNYHTKGSTMNRLCAKEDFLT